MSFAETFKKMHEVTMSDREFVDNSVNHIARTFDGITLTDAFILREALTRAISRSMQALGEEIDSIAPRLQSKALPLLVDRVPDDLAVLKTMITLQVLGMDGPSQGCDCASCRQKQLLSDELDRLEVSVSQLGEHS